MSTSDRQPDEAASQTPGGGGHRGPRKLRGSALQVADRAQQWVRTALNVWAALHQEHETPAGLGLADVIAKVIDLLTR